MTDADAACDTVSARTRLVSLTVYNRLVSILQTCPLLPLCDSGFAPPVAPTPPCYVTRLEEVTCASERLLWGGGGVVG